MLIDHRLQFYTIVAAGYEKIKPLSERNRNYPKTEITEMAENLEIKATETQDPSLDTEAVTPQDIAEVIREFEQYRQRLIDEMTTVAQKAKLPKSKMMARLEPELAQIDATLENLRTQHATLTGN